MSWLWLLFDFPQLLDGFGEVLVHLAGLLVEQVPIHFILDFRLLAGLFGGDLSRVGQDLVVAQTQEIIEFGPPQYSNSLTQATSPNQPSPP